MVQMILSLAIPFAITLMKLLTKNPKVSAEEGALISEFAQAATQADTAANGTIWTSSAAPSGVAPAPASSATPTPSGGVAVRT